MCKSIRWPLIVSLALLLVGVFLLLPARLGPGVLDSESNFYPAVDNSLYYLDQAKWQWAEEKHVPDGSTPTLEDLAPYLGRWKVGIERLQALGISYKITPLSETNHQSDIATLTRDLRFQRGFCRFYPAGTSDSFRTDWVFPQSSNKFSFRVFYIDNQYLLGAVFLVLAMGNLLVFLIIRLLYRWLLPLTYK
jgi:hypothetical protein